jgi:hypothetical protein
MLISRALCGTLFPRLRASPRVHDQLEMPSTITLKRASTIAEIRTQQTQHQWPPSHSQDEVQGAKLA